MCVWEMVVSGDAVWALGPGRPRCIDLLVSKGGPIVSGASSGCMHTLAHKVVAMHGHVHAGSELVAAMHKPGTYSVRRRSVSVHYTCQRGGVGGRVGS